MIFLAGGAAGLAVHAFLRKPLTPTQLALQAQAIDIGYVQSMLVHHQQAVVMGGLAEKGCSAAVMKLAGNIVRVQSAEIAQLRGWLAGMDAPALPENGDLMGWMKQADALLNLNERLYLERCAASPMGMAGLLSAQELRQLQTEQRIHYKSDLFLRYMIAHHEGALAMSTLPSRHAQTGFVREIANHVLQKQANEIGYMKDLLG